MIYNEKHLWHIRNIPFCMHIYTKSLAFIRDSFVLIRESYALIRESFS